MIKVAANYFREVFSEVHAGKNWVEGFTLALTEFKFGSSHSCNYQQALIKNLHLIAPWFDLFRDGKAEYGVNCNIERDDKNFLQVAN